MSDLRLTWNATANAADFSITANDLTKEDGLETAVLLSLFLDRRADDGDVLPAPDSDRRGWWADDFPIVDADRIGSRLWMLSRSKATVDVLSRTEQYAREALQWLLDDRVAERIEVSATTPIRGMIVLEVSIYRPSKADPARYRFDGAWRAQES